MVRTISSLGWDTSPSRKRKTGSPMAISQKLKESSKCQKGTTQRSFMELSYAKSARQRVFSSTPTLWSCSTRTACGLATSIQTIITISCRVSDISTYGSWTVTQFQKCCSFATSISSFTSPSNQSITLASYKSVAIRRIHPPGTSTRWRAARFGRWKFQCTI